MLKIGKTDTFEREYMSRFRLIAGKFGEFVSYERDRGARDIGLHLTRRTTEGEERLSSSLVWFQMKGLMSGSVSSAEFRKSTDLKLSLQVLHLKYWFLQPMPTYLVVYVESVDTFLILNIQDYIGKKWGKDILKLSQETANVAVPTNSTLDEQAFRLILTANDVKEWQKVLDADDDRSVRLCRRDYNLIWQIGTAEERRVEHVILFWDWQSKTRSQFYIKERKLGEKDWITLREHWQFMMNIGHLEDAYPYLELYSLDDQESYEDDDENEDEEDDFLAALGFGDYVNSDEFRYRLSNGEVVCGADRCGELIDYTNGVLINEMEVDKLKWVRKI